MPVRKWSEAKALLWSCLSLKVGSARLAGPLSHASKLGSHFLLSRCYVLLVSGFDHAPALPKVVVVDVDTYIENQR